MLDMESTIQKNKINYANRVAKMKKYMFVKITRSTHKGSWKEVTDKISDNIGIIMEDKVGKTHTNKRKLKSKSGK